MPDPSYFPIIVAAGMFIMALGLITNYWICLGGFAVLFAGIYGWCFEPVHAPSPDDGHDGHAAHAAPAATPHEPVAAH